MSLQLVREARTACYRVVEGFAHTWLPGAFRPDIFVIGGQKCGTTALANFLSKHPQLVGVKDKEAHYFNRDRVYARGQAWYAQQFPGTAAFRAGVRLFDATPCYLYHPAAPERIREYAPDARLLAVLREPAARAWSAYVMMRNVRENFREVVTKRLLLDANPGQRDPMIRLYYSEQFPDFGELVEREIALVEAGDRSTTETSLVRRGLYAEQLERYFKLFPRERLMVIEDRDLRNNREEVMGRVTAFLGLRPFDWKTVRLKDQNVRDYKEKPEPAVKARLHEFFKPYNEQLFELLGQRFSWEPKP